LALMNYGINILRFFVAPLLLRSLCDTVLIKRLTLSPCPSKRV
jgi:hypothetical protein